MTLPLELKPDALLGTLEVEDRETALPGGAAYCALAEGDGLAFTFPAGALADARFLTSDMLLEGRRLGVFRITLQEGDDGPAFYMDYGLLNQCSARMRLPLEAVDQNRWQFPREGAWLKPMAGGQRVDLARVTRMTLRVLRLGDEPARWSMTPIQAVAEAPPLLDEPLLPNGPLLDALGQNALYDWPGKSRDLDEVKERLHAQLAAAPAQRWPASFSRWGGRADRTVEATGFFRTHYDGTRWWLVDPDGCLFWSAGMDCVRVDTDAACSGLNAALAWKPDTGPAAYTGIHGLEHVNYLAANFSRTFGDDWHDRWAEISLAELRRVGVNTVANWSEWTIAKAAGFPYVRPLEYHSKRAPLVFREFPDVFHPGFEADCAEYAEQLRETADDPAFLGYFLMNEPTWGFAAVSPAEGMLFNTTGGPARAALADFLRERHASDAALADAWGLPATFAALSEGEWATPLTPAARADMEAFSATMTERLFDGMTDACHKVDPNHLNLGARYYTVPPAWALKAMSRFDVFSMNCYEERVNPETVSRIVELLDRPVMVGEWHFGALDVGLPGSGIGHVKDQAARGAAYRVYLEDAAAQPGCVGVHYFTLYDESALGRFDGENWNIGFLDVCNRPYAALCDAARASHERMYTVAAGEAAPYDDAPEYLPKLFL